MVIADDPEAVKEEVDRRRGQGDGHDPAEGVEDLRPGLFRLISGAGSRLHAAAHAHHHSAAAAAVALPRFGAAIAPFAPCLAFTALPILRHGRRWYTMPAGAR